VLNRCYEVAPTFNYPHDHNSIEIADMYESMGHTDKALTIINEYSKNEKENTIYYHNLMSDIPNSVDLERRVALSIQLTNQMAQIYHGIANKYYSQGKPEKAQAVLNKWLYLESERMNLMLDKGNSIVENPNHKNALSQLFNYYRSVIQKRMTEDEQKLVKQNIKNMLNANNLSVHVQYINLINQAIMQTKTMNETVTANNDQQMKEKLDMNLLINNMDAFVNKTKTPEYDLVNNLIGSRRF
jgi:tetratricopeptide (TPR) repeat protein